MDLHAVYRKRMKERWSLESEMRVAEAEGRSTRRLKQRWERVVMDMHAIGEDLRVRSETNRPSAR